MVRPAHEKVGHVFSLLDYLLGRRFKPTEQSPPVSPNLRVHFDVHEVAVDHASGRVCDLRHRRYRCISQIPWLALRRIVASGCGQLAMTPAVCFNGQEVPSDRIDSSRPDGDVAAAMRLDAGTPSECVETSLLKYTRYMPTSERRDEAGGLVKSYELRFFPGLEVDLEVLVVGLVFEGGAPPDGPRSHTEPRSGQVPSVPQPIRVGQDRFILWILEPVPDIAYVLSWQFRAPGGGGDLGLAIQEQSKQAEIRREAARSTEVTDPELAELSKRLDKGGSSEEALTEVLAFLAARGVDLAYEQIPDLTTREVLRVWKRYMDEVEASRRRTPPQG
jgi:hypothetical protein